MVNQVRRRKERLPIAPPGLVPPDVTSPRFYCPDCGEVRPEDGLWEVEGDDGIYRPSVRRHVIYRAGPWPKGDAFRVGESMKPEMCPGGTIDLTKDRAP